MKIRRLVLAIGAGIVLLFGGLGSASAAGCVGNTPNPTEDGGTWIGVKPYQVRVPTVNAPGKGPVIQFGFCFPDPHD